MQDSVVFVDHFRPSSSSHFGPPKAKAPTLLDDAALISTLQGQPQRPITIERSHRKSLSESAASQLGRNRDFLSWDLPNLNHVTRSRSGQDPENLMQDSAVIVLFSLGTSLKQ